MRLGPRDARVLLWEEGARLYVMWCSAGHWDAIKCSLREWFPRHGQLSYDGGRQRWSVPLTERERLEHWLGAMCTRASPSGSTRTPVASPAAQQSAGRRRRWHDVGTPRA